MWLALFKFSFFQIYFTTPHNLIQLFLWDPPLFLSPPVQRIFCCLYMCVCVNVCYFPLSGNFCFLFCGFFLCFEIIWWLKVSHGKQEDFPVSPPLHTLHLSLSPSPPPLFLPSSAYKSNYDGCATDWGLKWVRFQLSPFSRKTGDPKSRDWQLPRPLSTLFPPLRCFNVSKQRENHCRTHECHPRQNCGQL